jgi:uncharacterized membrane protein
MRFEGQVWVALGIGICLYAYTMDLGTFRDPGVGFVAFAAGIFLIVVGILLAASSRKTTRKSPEESAQRNPISGSLMQTRVFKITYTIALLIIYGLLLDYLGYVLTTFAVMFGLFFDRSRRNPVAVPLGAAFLTTGITYLVFEVWFQSQLPHGIFPWW